MGIVTSLVQATAEQLDGFVSEPAAVEDFMWRTPRPPSAYLDKSVDAIQAVLDAASVVVSIAPQRMPGQPLVDARQSVFFAIYPSEIKAMLTALAPVSRDDLAARLGDADRGYVLANYDTLAAFLAHAARDGAGAIMSHN